MTFYLLNTIPHFQYYSTFSIETKYGFNKTTLKTFLLDKIKEILLGLLIGGLLLCSALWIYNNFESGY